MPSRRGSASIISFNFDNILELYLNYLGFDVTSVYSAPVWYNRADVKVYHPHGFLPYDAPPSHIIFAKRHYDNVVGDIYNIWKPKLLDILRCNTCIFIGLSGIDNNLTSILEKDVKDLHVSKTNRHLFWGVRFADKNDTRAFIWENRGVFQQKLDNYDELPSWLFEISQLAAQNIRR